MTSQIITVGAPAHLRPHASQHKALQSSICSQFAGQDRCKLLSGSACFARRRCVEPARGSQLLPVSYQVILWPCDIKDCLFWLYYFLSIVADPVFLGLQSQATASADVQHQTFAEQQAVDGPYASLPEM